MQTEPTPIYVRRKSCLFVDCMYVRMCACVHVRMYQARQGNHKRQSGVRQRKPMNPALAVAHGRAFFSLNRRRAAERNKIKKNKEQPERSNQQPNPLHVRQSARQTDTDRPPPLNHTSMYPPEPISRDASRITMREKLPGFRLCTIHELRKNSNWPTRHATGGICRLVLVTMANKGA